MNFLNFFSLRDIIEIILELSTKKNRALLIRIFKFLGLIILFFGIIGIFIGYTTGESNSGFSGIWNLALISGGIACCILGFQFITGWFSVFQNLSLYDPEYSKNNYVPTCLLYTSPSPRDVEESRMPSSA